jgi:hypothetical protein
MFKKISNIILRFKSRTLRSVLGFFGLCSACFLFEACYGSPQGSFAPDYNSNTSHSVDFNGIIKSKDSLAPIPGLSVMIGKAGTHDTFKTTSNSSGAYSKFADAQKNDQVYIIVKDMDDSLNGKFYNLDTTIDISGRDVNNASKVTDILLKRKP